MNYGLLKKKSQKLIEFNNHHNYLIEIDSITIRQLNEKRKKKRDKRKAKTPP